VTDRNSTHSTLRERIVEPGLEMASFFWFGGSPGEPLPPIAEYHAPLRATHNRLGERPPRQNHRLIPAAKFRAMDSLDDVLEALFGALPDAEPV
jgi:hypothetical protein